MDRIADLCRRAPAGKLLVQLGDAGRERPTETGPTYVRLEDDLRRELERRPLHVHLHDVPEWAPEYAACRDQVLEQTDAPAERFALTTVIRIFSPDVPVALHADGEVAIDCGVGGVNTWHFMDRDVLSQEEHEALHRGGQFLRWREAPTATFVLRPGDGCVVPPRAPHWLEHPGPEPAVSFDVGYWTREAIHERKVNDVNWMLRRLRLRPARPGARPGRDERKRRAFDAVSRLTGKGAEYRGV